MANTTGKKAGGRAKGTPNKKTQDVIDKLESLDCDPIEGMALIASNAAPCLLCEATGYIEADKEKEICPTCSGTGKIIATIELRGQMYKELAQYVAPKRKAIEHTGSNDQPLDTLWTVTVVKAG